MFSKSILLNLQHYLQHHFVKFAEFIMENKVWGSFSQINFQTLDGNCNIILVLLHLSVYMHISSK